MGFPTNWQGPAPSCMEHAKPLRPSVNQDMRAAAHFLPESRFIHPDEAAFVQGLYMTFLHGPAGGTGSGINVAADRFHILAHPAYRIAGNAPQKGGDTQNNQFAFHRFIGRVPSNQTLFLRPRSKNRQSCHEAPCHSPFLPCVPKTLKKHAPKEKNAGWTFRPIRNHYYLLPR